MEITEYEILNGLGGSCCGIKYVIENPGRKNGEAEILFRTVDETLQEIRQLFLDWGLHDEDPIVHLNIFYPNGKGLNESRRENMGNGVGGMVLNQISDTAVSRGRQAIYVFTIKKSMQAFLRKNGFHTFGYKNTLFAKKLGEHDSE